MIIIKALKAPQATKDPINGGGKNSNNYFCGHCKIKRNSIQHCYKIHSYPGSIERKIVVCTLNENVVNNANDGGTGLTSKKLSNMLAFLNKKDASIENKKARPKDDCNCISSGNLVGTLCYISKTI